MSKFHREVTYHSLTVFNFFLYYEIEKVKKKKKNVNHTISGNLTIAGNKLQTMLPGALTMYLCQRNVLSKSQADWFHQWSWAKHSQRTCQIDCRRNLLFFLCDQYCNCWNHRWEEVSSIMQLKCCFEPISQ